MTDLRALAAETQSAQDRRRALVPFTARFPGFDMAAAYEVAHHLHRARIAEGASPVGRKIGFSNPAIWDEYGVREPIWGSVYDRTVLRLRGTEASCALGRFAEPKIEPEIVLGLRVAPRPGAPLAELADAVAWVAHGIEIVQSHFPGWKFQAPDTVADAALHGTLLVGPPQPLASLAADALRALESFHLDLLCGGGRVDTGRGANVLGSPLAALAHLVSVLARQPDYAPLAPGEIVTTGTVTAAHPVRPGETWRTALRGITLPGLVVHFTE